MTLAAGTKLGPYEIVAPIGVGGMGEVYRARDERLGRDVAIKVLPAELSADVSRLKRFEKEAQSASALNHPNIVTIHDIGSENGVAYIAMERVDGETLRKLLFGGPLPLKKLLSVAIQIAEGLAKAHEAGIVHRDLKPENVMVTKDGIVKILDFGLAKLTGPLSGSDEGSHLPTMTGTSSGVVVGTVGYMSPEQANGESLGFPSDQFSFGSILYEMATGKRAFQKATAIDTLSAILHEEPRPLAEVNPQAPAPLRWIVERCLAKEPSERYAATADLARDLRGIREHMSEAVSGSLGVERPRRRARFLGALLAAAAVGALVAGVMAYLAARKTVDRPPPSYQQLTFRRGEVLSARFGPDGETIVYTAAWDGKPMEIFVGRIQSADARPFGLAGAGLLAIAKTGEMAVSLNRHGSPGSGWSGTLARVPISGGTAPREVLTEIGYADWSPDGKALAIVREGKLEYPPGKVLYEVKTDGWLSDPRISPDGESVALIDHKAIGQDEGTIVVVNRSGAKRTLAGQFYSAQGVAWSTGGEVWFTAAAAGTVGRTLYSASPTGEPRLRARIAGSMTLQDISPQGRFLVTRDTTRGEFGAVAPGETKERDLTWLDWSSPIVMSLDAKTVLFNGPGAELGPLGSGGGDAGYYVYLRKTDGSPPVRLGEGQAASLSPDGRWALAWTAESAGGDEPDLIIYPTGAGEAKHLPKTGHASWGMNRACMFPDNKRFVIAAAEPGHDKPRVWIRDVDGGKPIPLTPEDYGGGPVSPDGKSVLVISPAIPSSETKVYICAVPGGALTEIKGLGWTDRIALFSADGRSLFVVGPEEIPRKIYRVDPATGRRTLIRTVGPADLAGVSDFSVVPSAREDAYLYKFNRRLSDLFIVEGLR